MRRSWAPCSPPITSLAVVLGQIVEKNGGTVESSEAPAEEAPAAE